MPRQSPSGALLKFVNQGAQATGLTISLLFDQAVFAAEGQEFGVIMAQPEQLIDKCLGFFDPTEIQESLSMRVQMIRVVGFDCSDGRDYFNSLSPLFSGLNLFTHHGLRSPNEYETPSPIIPCC